MSQARGKLEEVGPGGPSGLHADIVEDRQLGRLVGDERVVAASDIAAVSDVRPRGLKRDVRRQAVRLAVLDLMPRDNRADRGIHLRGGIGPPLGFEVAGLKHLVWLVVALSAIHRAEDRELVEHRRLFGKMLTDDHAGQFGRDHAKRPAIHQGTVGLGVPRVDLARPPSHPEENDRLIATNRLAVGRSLGATSQQFGKAKTRQTGQARLEHVATARDDQPLALKRIGIGERVSMSMSVSHRCGPLVERGRQKAFSQGAGWPKPEQGLPVGIQQKLILQDSLRGCHPYCEIVEDAQRWKFFSTPSKLNA